MAQAPRPPYCQGFMITLRRTKLVRTPLDEWSPRRRDLYLTTHNTHKRKTSYSQLIPIHNPSKRAAADPRLRPRDHWDRQKWYYYKIFPWIILSMRHIHLRVRACQSCRHYSSKHKLQISSFWMLMTTFGRKMGDFRLPPRSRWYLPSSAILRSVEWQFRTDVSGQHIGPIFKGQETDRLPRNFGKQLLLFAA